MTKLKLHSMLTVHNKGKYSYIRLPVHWTKYLKNGEQLPASIHGIQLRIDLRKIIGQKINNSFKGPYYTQAQMDKKVKEMMRSLH